jgi:hypothetical protein
MSNLPIRRRTDPPSTSQSPSSPRRRTFPPSRSAGVRAVTVEPARSSAYECGRTRPRPPAARVAATTGASAVPVRRSRRPPMPVVNSAGGGNPSGGRTAETAGALVFAARHRFHAIRRGSCGYDASIGVSGRPSRSWSAPPGVIARGRNLQDARHCANRRHGLVRAHEPVNPFGLVSLSRANQSAAFARTSRS